jgi:bifunctional non-homologous end joining protein LigD
MGLEEYRKKRSFSSTPEPEGKKSPAGAGYSFVIQKHSASHLHYDFRLELDGVLKSWAVPKGPSVDPAEKRLAMETEDHPVAYGSFEGIIPQGQYGGGTVLLWDRGTWTPLEDPRAGYRAGKLKFQLHGEKLEGGWSLVRLRGGKGRSRGKEDGRSWLLIKEKDDAARPSSRFDVIAERPESVVSGRDLAEIASKPEGIWDSRTGFWKPHSRVREAGTPRFVPPQLATLAAEPPLGDGWLHEIKLDGYRILASLGGGKARLFTRNGKDWTDRLEPIGAAVEGLSAREVLLDGEVVVLSPDGRTSFNGLQNIQSRKNRNDLVYFVFDLLHLDGRDLTKRPLEERKRLLRDLLGKVKKSAVRYSDHVNGEGLAVFQEACNLRLEGIVSKRRDAPYKGGRTKTWLKVKCHHEQEFVIVGFTEPEASRVGIGALLLGVHDGGELRYVGNVGTGFTHGLARTLRARLEGLETKTAGASGAPRSMGARWVKPELVAEVAFAEWTPDGKLRHPTFSGLREDKPAVEVVREEPGMPKPVVSVSAASRSEIAGVTLTHPDRVLYPEEGLTKRDVALYYERVAPWILPHLAGRPTTLVRCPEGIAKGIGRRCFYQKHVGTGLPATVTRVKIKEKSKVGEYVVVDSLPSLIVLVQLGFLELHTSNARADRLEQPDRLVFDLDPDPSLPWDRVVAAALAMRKRLSALGLASFVKTTGGKGLHVVTPIVRGPDWETCLTVSRRVVQLMEADEPHAYITTMSKEKRTGRVFLDYLRNARGATSVAAYSTRARAGAPVSVPISWDEVPGADPRRGSWTVQNLRERLTEASRDPWEGYASTRQRLTASLLRTVAARKA